MRFSRNSWMVVLLLSIFYFSCVQSGGDAAGNPLASLPAGWHVPLQKELARGRCGIRPDTPLEVGDDFNGDGKQDRAVIAVNTLRNRSGLLVNMSFASASRWEIIEESEGTCATFGLDVYKPGAYTGYFCAATTRNCKSTKKETIKTVLPGLSFFDFGSAGVIFFWNTEARAFDRLWEGD